MWCLALLISECSRLTALCHVFQPVCPTLALGLVPYSLSLPSRRPLFPRPISSEFALLDYLAANWFQTLFGELKPQSGDQEKADLQNDTAMRIGLAIIFRLSDQARRADPDNYRQPTPRMLRVYGLVTTGPKWNLKMMTAEADGSYVSQILPSECSHEIMLCIIVLSQIALVDCLDSQ